MESLRSVFFKIILIDYKHLYIGSANFTGAGLGAKNDKKRNFEMGFILKNKIIINEVIKKFKFIWDGKSCLCCNLKQQCDTPISSY